MKNIFFIIIFIFGIRCISQDILVIPSEYEIKKSDRKEGTIKFIVINNSGINYDNLILERICIAPTEKDLESLDCVISGFQRLRIETSKSSNQKISIPEGDFVGFIQIRGSEDFENIYSRIVFDSRVSENSKCSHTEVAEGLSFLDIEKCTKLKIRNGKTTEIELEITSKFESFFGEALFIGIISFGLASPQMNIRHTKVNLKNSIN
ncbi:hypothetical protein [Leptospira neocaledonica]|uniref:Uncharacterized protein n=1 Tax=Leptospira neocaledonica TaxID=2023192 RepID=A0A2M9ZZD4_9LEPT|nr:hypothetical protein [Leptospira neocaledonica]PJZ77409.1 hypothetical protein CH365_07415 [Leptospira neocaledonica]